ncbi:hypothetical protein GGR00_005636 [Aminobacter aganoensis]|uniref:Uncharacterized protein n=1 Tax=Aminobacter aganoensis TaxID=83264 RepID=A0A7X0FDL0_9HYPH|nr:hypothetical protein [Aminobacter aganoensis]
MLWLGPPPVDDLAGDFVIKARPALASASGAVFVDIADLRAGRREVLSQPPTRHGNAANTLTLWRVAGFPRRRGWPRQRFGRRGRRPPQSQRPILKISRLSSFLDMLGTMKSRRSQASDLSDCTVGCPDGARLPSASGQAMGSMQAERHGSGLHTVGRRPCPSWPRRMGPAFRAHARRTHDVAVPVMS